MALHYHNFDDLGLEPQDCSQLFKAGKLAVEFQGGLAIHRYELTIWQALVVGFLLCNLPLSAGTDSSEFELVLSVR